MARSRGGRSRGRPSAADSGLPSWAQRHLDEAGDPPAASAPVRTSHRRSSADSSRLRGWGVAIVSVAAAVGVVPLAITSLANDHSDDPLPKVDTYPAGSPAPLIQDNGAGGATARRPAPGAIPGAPSPAGDPATAGIVPAQPGDAAAPVVPATAVPAAVVRSTTTITPTTTATTTAKPTTSRSATPTTTEAPEQSRSATKSPASKPPASTSKPAPKPQSAPSNAASSNAASSNAASPKESGGLVPNTVRDLGNTVGGVAGSLGL